jgi:transposase
MVDDLRRLPGGRMAPRPFSADLLVHADNRALYARRNLIERDFNRLKDYVDRDKVRQTGA